MLMRRATVTVKFIVLSMVLVFVASFLALELLQIKQSEAALLSLPEPNSILESSADFSLAQLKGLKIDLKDPYNLSFIIEHGDQKELSQQNATELIRFFMAALAIPREELWVNLSPYENNRIINQRLEETELGEVFLKQDYVLKQLSSSLTSPTTTLGKDYWKQLEEDLSASEKDAFNKVWVSPQGSEIFVKEDTVIINSASLKVQTEADYLAMKENNLSKTSKSQAMELILAELSREINQGKHFSRLRQVYNALILADWFKNTLKESVYSKYIDSQQMENLDLAQEDLKEKVWQLYCKSFNDGVYKTVKKENKVKRSYFSGGLGFESMGEQNKMASPVFNDPNLSEINVRTKTSSSAVDLTWWMKKDLEGALSSFNISTDKLEKQFKASLSALFEDKDQLKEMKNLLRDGDLTAYKKIADYARSHDNGLKSIRTMLLSKIVRLSPKGVPQNIDLTSIDTIIASVFLKTLGVSTEYYESKNGPVLLRNKFSKRDNILIDLAMDHVLKIPDIVNKFYIGGPELSALAETKLDAYDYSNVSAYAAGAFDTERTTFNDADLYVNYPFFRKLHPLIVSNYVLINFAEAFKMADNQAKYAELAKRAGKPWSEKFKLETLINEYRTERNKSAKLKKMKQINKISGSFRYDKAALTSLAEFYFEENKMEELRAVSEDINNLEPYNIHNHILRLKAELNNYPNLNQDRKAKDQVAQTVNVLLDRLLSIQPDIVEFNTGEIGLDILNALAKRNSKLFDRKSGDDLSDLRFALSLLRQALSADSNKELANIVEQLIASVQSGNLTNAELVKSLHAHGLPHSLYDSVRDMVQNYDRKLSRLADNNNVAKRVARQYEETLAAKEEQLAQKEATLAAVTQEKIKAEHERNIARSESELTAQQVSFLKVENQQFKQRFINMQEEISNAREAEKAQASADRIALLAEIEELKKQNLNSETAFEEFSKSDGKFATLRKRIGPKLDEAFAIKEGQRRNVQSVLNRALQDVGEAIKLKAWFFDVFPEDDVVEFKADAQYGFESQSFFNERKPALHGEKALVAELYSEFYKKIDDDGTVLETSLEERKKFIDEINNDPRTKNLFFLYSSADFSQLGIVFLDRTEIPDNFKNPGEKDATGGYAGDRAKYGNKVPEEKLKQMGFIFLDQNTMVMWNQWMQDGSDFEPNKLINSDDSVILRKELNAIFDDYKSAKEWYVEKYKLYRTVETQKANIDDLRSQVSSLEQELKGSEFDTLTGLFNEGYYAKFKDLIFEQTVNKDLPLSMIKIELDQFKDLNHNYGRSVGNLVLKDTARVIKESIAGVDGVSAFSFGGEEMFVLAPIKADDAVVLGESIRASIAANDMSTKVGAKNALKITASIGVTSVGNPAMSINKKEDGSIDYDKLMLRGENNSTLRIKNIEELFNSADTYLSVAKENGRNNVVYLGSDAKWHFLRDQDMSMEQIREIALQDTDLKSEKEKNSQISEKTETAQVEEDTVPADLKVEIDKSVLDSKHIQKIIDDCSSARINVEWSIDEQSKDAAKRAMLQKVEALRELKDKLSLWQSKAELSNGQKVLIDRNMPKIEQELAQAIAQLDAETLNVVQHENENRNLRTTENFVERRTSRRVLPASAEASIIVNELDMLTSDLLELKSNIDSIINNGPEFEAKMTEFEALLKTIEKVRMVHNKNQDVIINEDAVVDAVAKFEEYLGQTIRSVRAHESNLEVKEQVITEAQTLLPKLEKLANDLIRYNEKHESYNSFKNEFNETKKKAEALIARELGFTKDQQLLDALNRLEVGKDELFAEVVRAIQKQQIIKKGKEHLLFVAADAQRSDTDFLSQYNDILAEDLPARMRDQRIAILKNTKISYLLDKLDALMDYLEANSLSVKLTSEMISSLEELSNYYENIANISGYGANKSKDQVEDIVAKVKSRLQDENTISELSFEKLIKYMNNLNSKFARTLSVDEEITLNEEDFESQNEEQSKSSDNNPYLKGIDGKDKAIEFMQKAYSKVYEIEAQMLQLRADAAAAAEKNHKIQKNNEYNELYPELIPYLEAMATLADNFFIRPLQDFLEDEIVDVINPVDLEGYLFSSTDESHAQFRTDLDFLCNLLVDLGMLVDRLYAGSDILSEEDYNSVMGRSYDSLFAEIRDIGAALEKDGGDPKLREKLEMDFSDRNSVVELIYKHGTQVADSKGDWSAHTAIGLMKNSLDIYKTKLSKILMKFPESSPRMDDALEGTVLTVDDSLLSRQAHVRFYKTMENLVKGSQLIEGFQMQTLKQMDESGMLEVVRGGPATAETFAFFKPSDEYLNVYRGALPWFAKSDAYDAYLMVYSREDIELVENVNQLSEDFHDFLSGETDLNEDVKEMMNDYFFKLVILQGAKILGFDLSDKIVDGAMSEEEKKELFESYVQFINLSVKGFYENNKVTFDNLQITEALSPKSFVREMAFKLNIALPEKMYNDIDLIAVIGNNYPYFNYSDWSFIWSLDRTSSRLKEFIYRYSKRVQKLMGLSTGYELKSSRLYSNFANGIVSEDTLGQVQVGKKFLEEFEKNIAKAEIPEVDIDTEQERIAEEQVEELKENIDELNSELDQRLVKIKEFGQLYINELKAYKAGEENKAEYSQALELFLKTNMAEFKQRYEAAQLDFSAKENEIKLVISELNKKIVESENAYAMHLVKMERIKQDSLKAQEIRQALPNIRLFANQLITEYQNNADTVADTEALLNEALQDVMKYRDDESVQVLMDDIAQIVNKVSEAKKINEKKLEQAAQQIPHLDINRFESLANELSAAYDSFAESVDKLEKGYDGVLAKITNGEITLAEGTQGKFDAIKARMLEDKKSYLDNKDALSMFSSSVVLDGGLDFSESNYKVNGNLAELEWDAVASEQRHAMTFKVLSFKRVDSKTVLASL